MYSELGHELQHVMIINTCVILTSSYCRVIAAYRCNTCGEYIYKGKKFNSRKETVENETYLGLHIFRFYIKCPGCIAEIAFKVSILCIVCFEFEFLLANISVLWVFWRFVVFKQ